MALIFLSLYKHLAKTPCSHEIVSYPDENNIFQIGIPRTLFKLIEPPLNGTNMICFIGVDHDII